MLTEHGHRAVIAPVFSPKAYLPDDISPQPLAEAARDAGLIIVMGGDGWTLREWYLSGALKKHLPASKDVDLYSVDTFIANANKGKL